MGFGDWFRNFFGYSDMEYDEDGEARMPSGGSLHDDDNVFPYPSPEGRGTPSNVVNINTTAQLQVVLVKPERFEDASSIADHLNAKRTIVLNLESANRDVTRRLIDFLSGVAYANDGHVKRVANSTYIITPHNVGIQGDLLDELESSGVFF